MEFGSLHRWVRVRLGSVQSAVLSIFGSVRLWFCSVYMGDEIVPKKRKNKKK